MAVIVQKFGGTSVSTEENRHRCLQKIITEIENGNQVVAVVSAMGRKGEPYATDSLLELIKDEKTNKRDIDLLMSCGEIISSVVISAMLNSEGYRANAVTGFQAGIMTNGDSGSAMCEYINCSYIKALLDDNVIPIVAGFQGLHDGIEITTLGRGGSDTTAALIGAALHAERVDIFTDVDGIMTADPRIAADARIIESMYGGEVLQMAQQGAKVIHPRAVEAILRGEVNMFIKNTLNDTPGTMITYDISVNETRNNDSVITSIASMKNRSQIIINKIAENEDSDILNEMAKQGISIDLINIFTDHFVFTIDSGDAEKAAGIFDTKGVDYKIIDNLCKVTAIGTKMHGVPGVMARIVTALLNEGCEILQSSDSHMHISCLINAQDENKAVNALHKTFHLGKE
ncbi:MAG: aspartate kinase [Clostridia bacterium]|nr:aspartate kinase [Clostridia bacterium]